MRHSRPDIDTIKTIPILEVAQALGLSLKKTGAGIWNMRDADNPNECTSLCINERRNRWKRWSGKGEPNFGSVIDLVMMAHSCDFQAAIEYLSSAFPRYR